MVQMNNLFSSALLVAAAAAGSGTYDASTRSYTVLENGVDRFRYTFNLGGAVNGIYDLELNPNTNLVAPSYQGETTDRVIQWTYWNSRYKVDYD